MPSAQPQISLVQVFRYYLARKLLMGASMRRLSAALIAAVSAVAFTQFASAADLPRKAPAAAPPPAPVYSWTGFYVGGNFGYGWGHAATDFAANGSVTNTIGPGPGAFPFASPVSFSGSNKSKLDGVIGGGQLGYNYQFSRNAVVGFEADIQGSGQRADGQLNISFPVNACVAVVGGTCVAFGGPIAGSAVSSYQTKIDWFGTVRARLGYLVADQFLIYATGGLAYGKVAFSGTTNINAVIVGSGNPFSPATGAFGVSKTNVGFAVGGGVEGRLAFLSPNWTWKLEYLYLDLGSLDATSSFAMAPPVGTSLVGLNGVINTHTHFTDNIVRVGLNYQFH